MGWQSVRGSTGPSTRQPTHAMAILLLVGMTCTFSQARSDDAQVATKLDATPAGPTVGASELGQLQTHAVVGPGFLEHLRLSPRGHLGPGARLLSSTYTGPHAALWPGPTG